MQVKLPIPLKANKMAKFYETQIIRDKKGNIRKIIVGGGTKGALLTLQLTKQLYE